MTARAADPLAQEFVRFAVRCRRAALRRVQDQGRAAVALLLQRRPVRRRRQARRARGILCTPPAGQRVCRSTCCSARPTRASRWPPRWRSSWRGGPQRALRLQPQGSQGPRRRRHAGRRAGARARAHRRRRDLGRHLGARVDRPDPAAGATPCGVAIALDRQERAVEDGATPMVGGAVRHAALGLPVAAVATLDDLLQYLARPDPRCRPVPAAVQAYRDRYGV
jgi:hypothetical protein